MFNKNGSKHYLRFLKLLNVIREIPAFPELDLEETSILESFAIQWMDNRTVTVVSAMNMFPAMSPSTVHRRLTSLKNKGMIDYSLDDLDKRIKYIVPTDLSQSYFKQLEKVFNKILKSND